VNDGNSNLVLLGTAFPVTRRHIITTYHNLLDDSNIFLSNSFVIGKTVERSNAHHVMPATITVNFVSGDAAADFAFLAIANEVDYVSEILPLCPLDQLPVREVKGRCEVKAYHAPIGQYLRNEFPTLAIWTEDYKRVLQYYSLGKRIVVEGGLYRGSCGGPYVDHDGYVVAMHTASMHEGKNISNVKKRKYTDRIEDLESLASSLHDIHASVREGIVLSRIPAVIDFIAANSKPMQSINP
jgi:hypothetical protein